MPPWRYTRKSIWPTPQEDDGLIISRSSPIYASYLLPTFISIAIIILPCDYRCHLLRPQLIQWLLRLDLAAASSVVKPPKPHKHVPWEATGYATRRDILRAAATLSHALVRALAEEGYGVDFLADSYNTLAITRAFSIVTISTESGVQR